MGIEFGFINWLTLAAFLLATTWFGHRMSNKASNLDDFFLGGRKLPWWAVSGSIIASQISAVTIVATPGFLFRDTGNLLFLQGTLIGFIIAKFLMALIFVKPYYEKKIYSPYDFIENRLGSRASGLARILFVVGTIFGHGIRLLTIALVFSVVADTSIANSILIMAIVAVIWTLIGGIATVIWTDFILFIVIIAGAVITIVSLHGNLPFGLSEAIEISRGEGKLQILDWSLSPAKTWTVWTGLICFTIFELAQNSVDQVITQRMMCCRNYREARKAIYGSLIITVIILMMTVIGLGLWLFYRANPAPDKIAQFLADQPSRVFPYYVISQLPIGLSGLIIAAIFAAGISTLDSAIAALSETTINGFYKRFIKSNESDKHYVNASRVSVVIWGIFLAGLAYAWGALLENEALLNLAYKAPILTYGPMLMIALFALKKPCSTTAIYAGVIMGISTALIMLLVNILFGGVLDEFWIYPATCLTFLIGAGVVILFERRSNNLKSTTIQEINK
jgi:SSS family solute:Na+ symporter